MPATPGDDIPIDLLTASHRGLHRHLIPAWLKAPMSMSENIENSAYGETPSEIVTSILKSVALKPKDLFVDLGCGGGNVLLAALRADARVLGIERNPELFRAALHALASWPSDRVELQCTDFLQPDCDWSHGDVVYATTARFTPRVLNLLAERMQGPESTIRAAAFLGRPLPLCQDWTQDAPKLWRVRWNPGESVLDETLFIYRRGPRLLPGKVEKISCR